MQVKIGAHYRVDILCNGDDDRTQVVKRRQRQFSYTFQPPQSYIVFLTRV